MPQDKDKIWEEYLAITKKEMALGFKTGLVGGYTDELIKKFRNLYYGGMPASIILLCKKLCEGNCYESALLLSRAFLDTECDVKLVYGEVDSIKLNPKEQKRGKGYADHCFVEITINDGVTLVFDTTYGLVFNKEFYYRIQRPAIRMIHDKQSIIEHVANEAIFHPEEFIPTIDSALLNIPEAEKACNNPNETYAKEKLLQREINIYKELIFYDALKAARDKDMKKKAIELPKDFFKNNNESE